MPLTPAQRTPLRADIQADGTLNTLAHNTGSAQVIVDAYGVLASPDFWVWRTSVSKDEVVGSVSPDGTTFIRAGNGFLTRIVQELMAWQDVFGAGGSVNPSLPQIRQAFIDIFTGTTAIRPVPCHERPEKPGRPAR
jgi:hypothetical protein